MTTKELEKTVVKLSSEVKNLRSFVVSIINNNDDEGEYKVKFVQAIKKAIKNRPDIEYSGKGSLLRQIRTA